MPTLDLNAGTKKTQKNLWPIITGLSNKARPGKF